MLRLAVTFLQGPVLMWLALGRPVFTCHFSPPLSGFGVGNPRLWVAILPSLSGVAVVYSGSPGLISDGSLNLPSDPVWFVSPVCPLVTATSSWLIFLLILTVLLLCFMPSCISWSSF